VLPGAQCHGDVALSVVAPSGVTVATGNADQACGGCGSAFNLSNTYNASLAYVARASCAGGGACDGTVVSGVVPFVAPCAAASHLFVPSQTLLTGALQCRANDTATLDVTAPDGASVAYGCGSFETTVIKEKVVQLGCKCPSPPCSASLSYLYEPLPSTCPPFAVELGKKYVACSVAVPANAVVEFYKVCSPTAACLGTTTVSLTAPTGGTVEGAACGGLPCTYATYNASAATTLEVRQSCSPPLASRCASQTAYRIYTVA